MSNSQLDIQPRRSEKRSEVDMYVSVCTHECVHVRSYLCVRVINTKMVFKALRAG